MGNTFLFKLGIRNFSTVLYMDIKFSIIYVKNKISKPIVIMQSTVPLETDTSNFFYLNHCFIIYIMYTYLLYNIYIFIIQY